MKWKFVELQTSSTRNWESACGNGRVKDWINYVTIGCFSVAKIT